MKKILFCITRLNGGGAERALSNLTLAMPDEIQIDILVNCEESEKDYEHRGNVISIANVDKRLFRIPFPLKVLVGRYYNLWRLKKNGNYDACISLPIFKKYKHWLSNSISGISCAFIRIDSLS